MVPYGWRHVGVAIQIGPLTKRRNNPFAIKTGRGETAATLQRLETVDGQRIDLARGGKTVARGECTTIDLEPGKKQVTIQAGDEDQARRLSAQYMKKFGENPVLQNPTYEMLIDPVAEVKFECEIGGDASRAIAKTGLLLLASELGTDAVRGEDTRAVRNFITGGGESSDFARLDYETAFPPIPQHESLPPFAHRVAAIADPTARIAVALIELLGTFRYTILLLADWQGPALAIHYGVDPTTGEDAEACVEVQAPLTVEEFRSCLYPSTEILPRLERLFAMAKRRQIEVSIDEISEQVVREMIPRERVGTITSVEIAEIQKARWLDSWRLTAACHTRSRSTWRGCKNLRPNPSPHGSVVERGSARRRRASATSVLR